MLSHRLVKLTPLSSMLATSGHVMDMLATPSHGLVDCTELCVGHMEPHVSHTEPHEGHVEPQIGQVDHSELHVGHVMDTLAVLSH